MHLSNMNISIHIACWTSCFKVPYPSRHVKASRLFFPASFYAFTVPMAGHPPLHPLYQYGYGNFSSILL